MNNEMNNSRIIFGLYVALFAILIVLIVGIGISIQANPTQLCYQVPSDYSIVGITRDNGYDYFYMESDEYGHLMRVPLSDLESVSCSIK